MDFKRLNALSAHWRTNPPASTLLLVIAKGLGVIKIPEIPLGSKTLPSGKREPGITATGGDDGMMMAMFAAQPHGRM